LVFPLQGFHYPLKTLFLEGSWTEYLRKAPYGGPWAFTNGLSFINLPSHWGLPDRNYALLRTCNGADTFVQISLYGPIQFWITRFGFSRCLSLKSCSLKRLNWGLKSLIFGTGSLKPGFAPIGGSSHGYAPGLFIFPSLKSQY